MPRREITRARDEIPVKSTGSALSGAVVVGALGGWPDQIRNSCSILEQCGPAQRGSGDQAEWTGLKLIGLEAIVIEAPWTFAIDQCN